jgi:hypothetical protein
MTPEQRRKTESKYGPTPANRAQIEEICRLIPEREKEVWQLVHAKPHYLTDEQARAILAEARKPRLPAVATGNAERLHAQSEEVLAERQRRELDELRGEELRRQRYQDVIDYWHERKLADAAYEQRFRDDAGIEAYDRNVIWRGCR